MPIRLNDELLHLSPAARRTAWEIAFEFEGREKRKGLLAIFEKYARRLPGRIGAAERSHIAKAAFGIWELRRAGQSIDEPPVPEPQPEPPPAPPAPPSPLEPVEPPLALADIAPTPAPPARPTTKPGLIGFGLPGQAWGRSSPISFMDRRSPGRW